MTQRPRMLLIGAGHTHLYVLSRAAELRDAGLELALVAPDTFHYSGVATAQAVGALPAATGCVDVVALARRYQTRHHIGMATTHDRVGRRIRLDDGRWLGYDVMSFNVGSVTDGRGLQVADEVLRVKPLEELAALHQRIQRCSLSVARVSVVGGGPTGLELAGNLSATWGPSVRVTLLDHHEVVGAGLPGGARRYVARLMRRRRVGVRCGVAVRVVASDHVLLTDGTRVGHDLAVLATGLVAHPSVAAVGLGDERGIPVRETLQLAVDDDVYAVGDCAHFNARPLPKLGVYGVRQGPVLVESLLARARGAALPAYVPQRHALRILDLGGGVGLATRGRWWLAGRTAHRVKRRLDRRWLGRFT